MIASSLPLEYASLHSDMIALADAAQGHSAAAASRAAWHLWLRFGAAYPGAGATSATDPLLDTHLAAFATWLRCGRAGRRYAADTVAKYVGLARATICIATPAGLLEQVKKGISNSADPPPPKPIFEIKHLSDLLSAARAPAASYAATLVGMLTGYLTCTISRSQSATVRSSHGFAQGAVLVCRDVVACAVGEGRVVKFAQRTSKGDTRGKRLGPDGANWNYYFSSQGHPLDSESLYRKYTAALRLHGCYADSLPFFQEPDSRGLPSGRPLTYATALRLFRQQLAAVGHRHLATAGLHDLRRLGASQAFAKGLPSDLIAFQGGWRSSVYTQYLRLTEPDRTAIARHIVEAEVQPLSIAPVAAHTRALPFHAPARWQ